MVWGAIAAAVGQSAASIYSSSQANKANKKAAQAQMAFQERMSNTSYQRGMADMRLAGLNPILAYKTGGATTPSGSTYTANPVLGPAVASGLAAYGAIQTAQATRQAGIKTKQENERFRDYGDSVLGRQVHSAAMMAKSQKQSATGKDKSGKSFEDYYKKAQKDNKRLFGNKGKNRQILGPKTKAAMDRLSGKSKPLHVTIRKKDRRYSSGLY